MKFFLIIFFSVLASLLLATQTIHLPYGRLIALIPMFIPLWVLLIPEKKIYARILGLPSVAEDFTRGWLITGFTGSGKTCALIYLLFQIFKRVPNFGAVFLDQKGLFWEIVERMAKHFGREDDLVLVRTKPTNAPDSWIPKHTINILGDEAIPAASYATFLTDTYSSLNPKGEGGSSAFFKSKGQELIALGIEILRLLNEPVTIPRLERLLCDDITQQEKLINLSKLVPTNPDAKKIHQDILSMKSLPPEAIGGVIGNVGNILKPFTEKTIATIFCADKPTFSVRQIDEGKLVCVSIPQSFVAQRFFINTLLKLFFYFHAQCRFDKTPEERAAHNQIFLCADEGQEIITSAFSAFADHRQAATLREAKATMIIATQGYSSIYAALSKEHAEVLISSLANQLIFQPSSEENAKVAESFIGSRRKQETTHSYSSGKKTRSHHWEIIPYIHFWKFRKFPKFYCVAKLANGRWKEGYLTPITPEGKIPKWLWSRHPFIALRGLFLK
jgi:hypothetical protein